uniref:(northern house mosquito) hypothetical protein n=1 Tax=Culex pipiens TaxID=7175 RepID=A0A8D8C5T4_CULPI
MFVNHRLSWNEYHFLVGTHHGLSRNKLLLSVHRDRLSGDELYSLWRFNILPRYEHTRSFVHNPSHKLADTFGRDDRLSLHELGLVVDGQHLTAHELSVDDLSGDKVLRFTRLRQGDLTRDEVDRSFVGGDGYPRDELEDSVVGLERLAGHEGRFVVYH